MKRKKIIIIATIFLNTLSYAGDPCPIGFRFYDAGVAPWLDRDKILNQLESKERWFGISYRDKEVGVVVTKVYKNSPAEASDIRVGDIIYSIDNSAIKTSNNLSSYLDNKKINNGITVKIKRANKKIQTKVILAFRDPLLYRLNEYQPESCSQSYIKELSENEKREIYKKAFSSSKSFECKRAHEKLSKMKKFKYNNGQLVLIRGSKRIMLVEPQWGTVCVNSRDYDGKNLTDKQVKKLFNKIFSSYINDRFKNP